MSVRLCWTCKQPATHALTRDGSTPLDACDNCTRIDRPEAERRGWTITPITQPLTRIGPRTNEHENSVQHFWTRSINGIEYAFVHVKVSRLGRPYISVHRMDTGAVVRCSCPRTDCPSAN